MAEPPKAGAPGDAPGISHAFDRVGRPDPERPRRRDGVGKEALYSTAPTAAPTTPVEIRCRRCDAQFGLSALRAVKLLKPPWLWNPLRGRLWTHCPACDRRSWLEVRPGPALRVLLERPPTA